MSLLIERIHQVFNDLAGKNIATSYPPEKIDRVLNMVIVDTFNKWLDVYVKTTKISDYLTPFKREIVIPLTSGQGDLPGDYGHRRALFLTDGKTKVDVVEDKFWAGRATSKLSPPSSTRPIAQIENVGGVPKLRVLPNTVTGVALQYFKYPTPAKYGYTTNGDRYQYDESQSVDVEFPEGLFPDMVIALLGHFGIILRENQVIQFSEMLKAQGQLK